MPVHINDDRVALYQRNQYEKGGIGRLYWDYRDKVVLSNLSNEDQHIADIGCGEGITLEKVTRLFPDKDFIGVDPLQENLLICARHNLKITGGDVYNLPFRNRSFDCVLLLEVIEHLSNPSSAISEINRILKPVGKLIVIFPNDKMFRVARLMTCKFQEAFYDPGHITQWTPETAEELANHHGFIVIEQKSIPFLIWRFSLHHLMVCEKAKDCSA
jgi:ubiquinone/menaquinone biosynthesis C-methylase UbiE